MKRNVISLFLGLLLLNVVNLPLAKAAPVFNRIAAVVNGEMITMYDLEMFSLAQIRKQGLNPTSPQDRAQINRIMNNELSRQIDEIIIAQEAEVKGIRVDDARIDAEFAAMAERAGQDLTSFVRTLHLQGASEEMVKERLRKSFLRSQLLSTMVSRKIAVTKEDIDAFLKENPNFTPQSDEQSVVLALLVYPPSIDAEEEAQKIVADPKSFEKAVQALSVGPNPEGGGNVGELPMSDIDPDLRTQLSFLKVGQVTPLFELNGMKVQAKLIDRMGGETEETEEAIRKSVEEQVRGQKTQERFVEYMNQLRERAVIDIRL